MHMVSPVSSHPDAGMLDPSGYPLVNITIEYGPFIVGEKSYVSLPTGNGSGSGTLLPRQGCQAIVCTQADAPVQVFCHWRVHQRHCLPLCAWHKPFACLDPKLRFLIAVVQDIECYLDCEKDIDHQISHLITMRIY